MKKEEKKGISLVGFVVILIILVGLEGFYIVKLRNNPNSKSNDEIAKAPVVTNNLNENNSNDSEKANSEKIDEVLDNPEEKSSNVKIINSLGYDEKVMVDSIVDSLEQYAQNGLLIKNTVPATEGATEETSKITVEDINAIKVDYKTIIINNLGNSDIIKSLKFESNKLVCEYNIQNLFNLLNMTSTDYQALGANENNIKTFEF